MTPSLSLKPSATPQISPGATNVTRGKVYFDISPSEWKWSIIFMLSLSLTGLRMPLGNLLVIILLIREYKENREGFIAKLTLACGGFAFSQSNINWGVNMLFLMIPFALLAMCVLRKSIPLKQTIVAYTLFSVATIAIAVMWGVEGISVQLRQMMGYLSFCFFAIPMLAFSGEGFDMHRFWHTLFSLMMIACAFYIIDGYIIRGWVLVPCSWIDYEGSYSSWLHPIITGWYPRKYPPGLYPLALLIYPVAKYYRLKWWQWGLLVGAMCASRTSTILFSLVFGFILAQGSLKRYVGYGIIAAVIFTGLYLLDASMGYSSETEQSTMRIASTINQFTDLSEAEDDEDLSEAGTGRMAQALPPLEQIFDVGREWVGYGFVNVDTENPKAIIENEYVGALNPEMKYRAITDIEITQVKVFISLGFVGLAIWLGFIFGICRILKGMRYAGYYTNVAVVLMLYGVGGFDSWFTYQGIILGALAYSTVLLANKPQSLATCPGERPDQSETAPQADTQSTTGNAY